MSIINEIYLLFKRHLKKSLRSPIWILLGLLEPVLYLILYMPMLKNTGNNTLLPVNEVVRIFTPGMLVIMAMGMLFAGFSFIDEIRQGLIMRWLVTPASRIGIILSMVCNQVLMLLLQSAILLIIAFALGLQAPILGILLSEVLILLIGIAMTCFSYAVSISVKDEGILASITQTFFLPLMLLSGIMLPISFAPNWIQMAALFNPFFYAVEASRYLFAGNYANIVVWRGFLIIIPFTVFSLWLAVRSLQKMTE